MVQARSTATARPPAIHGPGAAESSIGGSGQATVWASKSLHVSVAGSGDIAYYGDPSVTKSMVGSGSIKRLGGAPQ